MSRTQTAKAAIISWITSTSSEQPILLLSYNVQEIADLCAFAKQSAVCTSEQKPCGTCPSCKQAIVGNHPDVITIEGEKDAIHIKELAVLKTMLTTKPSSGKRIVCIARAEQLLPEAANTLLKTLEESSTHTRFLLGAPAKRSILATVRSRCRPLFISRSIIAEEQWVNRRELLQQLSEIRPSGPYSQEELEKIELLIHTHALEKGSSIALAKTAMRLRDYYKAQATSGGNIKLASDILLASLAELRNTSE